MQKVVNFTYGTAFLLYSHVYMQAFKSIKECTSSGLLIYMKDHTISGLVMIFMILSLVVQ